MLDVSVRRGGRRTDRPACGGGDCALELTALLRELPGQAGKSVLCAVLWLVLPPAAALLRPAALWLSGIAAARGFVLALSLAVAVAQGRGRPSLRRRRFRRSSACRRCSPPARSCGNAHRTPHRGRKAARRLRCVSLLRR
ncbi:MAG: hypothetical protein ACLR4Z_01945 [Butyricicoccaceae bacterium]